MATLVLNNLDDKWVNQVFAKAKSQNISIEDYFKQLFDKEDKGLYLDEKISNQDVDDFLKNIDEQKYKDLPKPVFWEQW